MSDIPFIENFRYPPGMPATLQKLIADAFKKYSKNLLIISDQDGSIFSYADAEFITMAIARKLNQLQIGKGDFICTYASIHPENIFLFWACSLLGVVYIPLDHNWPHLMLQKVLDKVEPSLLFCDSNRVPEAIKTGFTSSRIVVFDELSGTAHGSSLVPFSEWIGEPSEEPIDLPDVAHVDTGVILFTSGTTSEPKGVMLSQGALCRSGWLVKKSFGIKADDIHYSIGELNAMSGLRNPCIATLHAGCSIITTSAESRSNIFSIAEAIKKYGASMLSTAPAVIRLFLQYSDRLPERAFKSLRQVVSTGSDLQENLINDFEKQFKIRLINYYGLTETCGLCIGNTVFHTGSGHQGTIGIPIGATAEVVDEDDITLRTGQAGELRIKGPNLMQGYFKNPELTAKVIRNRWFYTGDLAIIREDGHVVLIGRKSDIIKDVHANLIHPGEVESVLEMHANVSEAGVCGYVAEGGEERLAAFVVPVQAPDDEAAFFKELNTWIEKHLGPRKKPSKYFIRTELPRSANNKLLRRKLSEGLEQ